MNELEPQAKRRILGSPRFWICVLVSVGLFLAAAPVVLFVIDAVRSQQKIRDITAMLTPSRIELLKQTAERVHHTVATYEKGDKKMPSEFAVFDPSWVSVMEDRVFIMFIGGHEGFCLELNRETDGRWWHSALIDEQHVVLPEK